MFRWIMNRAWLGVAAVITIASVTGFGSGTSSPSLVFDDQAPSASGDTEGPAKEKSGAGSLDDQELAWRIAAKHELPTTDPQEGPGLHNVFRLSDRIMSGSEPETVKSLEYLAGQGVRTVVSVDGKVPDHEEARKLGLRYVHIPIQYSGLHEDEIMKLVKTFRELEGPFYVHCFHGKHRGPAAAAIGRLAIDGASREVALAEMRQWCGTGQQYGGLYGCVARCDVPEREKTKSFAFDFPVAHQFEGLRQAMIGLTRSFDALKLLSKHGWGQVEDHPDLDAHSEAVRLHETLVQCRDMKHEGSDEAQYRACLDQNIESAQMLREQLVRLRQGDESVREALMNSVKDVKQSCNDCHKLYRN